MEDHINIKMIQYLILILCLIFLLNRYPLHVNDLKETSETKPKCCLLLTMYANTEEREKMYKHIIDLWLENSSFKIYTVDSFGSSLLSDSHHSRWHAFSFIQKDRGKKCYSVLELEAIQKAEEYFNFSKFDFIIKLTGKYFLPKLEITSETFNKKSDLIFQKRHAFLVRFQNSEMFAFKPGESKHILKDFDTSFERTLYNYSRKKRVSRMPALKVTTSYARGDGSVLDWL